VSKREVYLHEFNAKAGHLTWLPVSAGRIQSHALSDPDVQDNYIFMPFIHIKEPVDEIMKKYHSPDVVAFSSYIWNEQINLRVSERVKRKYPDCLVVFGGPQVPFDPTEFLTQHPFIDVAVAGEGEPVFVEVLKRHIDGRDFAGIPSVSFIKDNEVISKTEDTAVQKKLDRYACPFESGVFDYLFDGTMEFQATIESNRGCPFACAFCYWGQGTNLAKQVRLFGLDRMKYVADWCGRKSIRYVWCADANFGMLKRDIEVANLFVEAKRKYGSPEKFRATYAKNAEDNVYEIANILHSEGMEKSITLARQSFDDTSLKNVKRSNIKLEVFNNLARRYYADNISVYTELILGLPGETYESFCRGLEQSIVHSAEIDIYVYFCSVLPNTAMCESDYLEKFQIKTARVPLSEIHYEINKHQGIPTEYENIIISTESLTVDEWKRCCKFAWICMMFYSLKVGIFPVLFLKSVMNNFLDFVDFLIDAPTGPLCQKVLGIMDECISKIMCGEHYSCIVDGSDLYWPAEEAGALIACADKSEFYREFYDVLILYLESKSIPHDKLFLRELVNYQSFLLPSMQEESQCMELVYNTEQVCESMLLQQNIDVCRLSNPVVLKSHNKYYNNVEHYARESIIYGRKSMNILRSCERIRHES